jgi:2-haloacid dehalogenase
LEADAELFDSVAERYNNLDPFPDAKSALESLSHYRLAVLSNGSPAMLGALMRNTGFDRLIGATISVDARRVFKLDPRAYSLVEERLGLSPKEVLFVSSNGFDVSGAKSYGFNVVRIDRAMTLRGTVTESGAPQLFRLLRAQVENIGYRSDFVVGTLSDLSALASSDFAAEH